MFVRQSGDGNYYVCRTPRGLGKSKASKARTKKSYTNLFLIKCASSASGVIKVGNIVFPQEFVGKRIRLKVEVL